MGFLSKLFGKGKKEKVSKREGNPDVYHIPSENERMNWGMEKSRLTLHYFESCLKEPKPEQQYFSIKVKIVDGEEVEHIWLSDPEFDTDGNLFGSIGNEPLNVTTVKLGQSIGIEKHLVSDWMIIEGGRLIGGYTIRAVREGLEGAALKQFDQGLGGMFIDEGEDYFEANFETPEGAIISLENAYTNNDLDAALSCKDFAKEAELMLQKTLKIDVDQELINKTAEVLRLSFVQHLQENGMPSFTGVKRAFQRQKVDDNQYIITEICYQLDGQKTAQKLNVYKTDGGWKVMAPED